MPEDLVVMGRVTGAFGVRGWVKVQPFTAEPISLLGYPVWWLGFGADWTPRRIEEAKVQAEAVAARFAGCVDRDAAAAHRGMQVAVSRSDFPQAGEQEYYWVDLIGLKVVNAQGEDLGTVAEVFQTGANDVLVLTGERERLIPFIGDVVREVNIAGGVIRVDWGADY